MRLLLQDADTDEQRALLPAHYSWDAVHKDWLGLYE